MEFHHIGVATRDIKKSIAIFGNMGFTADKIIFDDIQNVNICFVKKPGHPDIELIEPVNAKSPVVNILDKVGTTPYHFCYITNDISLDIIALKKKKFLVVVKPVNAIAFDGRKVCFCYHTDFGLIELVEK